MLKLNALLLLSFSAGWAQMPPVAQPPGSPIGPYVPMTTDEQWHRYWKESLLSPGTYLAASGAAIRTQISNDPPEWGGGVKAYSERAGSVLGLLMIQASVHDSTSALLGYDPRYFPCQCKGFFNRTAHAFEMSILTYNREGKKRIDFPIIAGTYGAGMLSMYWHPSRYNPLTDGVRIGTHQLGFQVGKQLFEEFRPEIKRLLHRK